MISDTTIIQGTSHAICQDYARSGDFYVLVSDGCSGSCDSDFGARLLVKLAEKNILSGNWKKDLFHETIQEASAIQDRLALEKEALDATLLALIADGESVTVMCAGDGMLLLEYTDEVIEVYDIEYGGGYPFYINYLLDESRLKAFLEINPVPEISLIRYRENSIEKNSRTRQNCLEGGCQVFTFPREKIKKAVLFSDGIKSFRQKIEGPTGTGEEKVDYSRLIFELTGFKSSKGRFTQRRVNRFLKECRRQNIANYDDLSVGALVF